MTVTGGMPRERSAPGISRAMVEEIMATAEKYFAPGQLLPRVALETIICEAISVCDENYEIEAAIKWAAGYTFPAEMLEKDLASFRDADMNFESMVRRRLAALSDDRLSRERVDLLREDNPERVLMSDLAEGMRVPLPSNFKPNGKMPTAALRSTYRKVESAVNNAGGGD